MNIDPHTLLSQSSLLWDFANRVYSRSEVETLSIELQDQCGANVNIMLWSCWLEHEGIRLPQSCLSDVTQIIDEVSHETVDKLREVRRFLKTSKHFTKVQALGIRKHILSAELVIEKVLLQRLQDLTCRFLETLTLAPDETALDLHFYLQSLDIPAAKNKAEILLRACAEDFTAAEVGAAV
ncbi:hypothetical protein TDB9533_01877 [Thalassocella blandensis]|nr:hypothetical protein TDB9533_01877 [Thalassocella blandensis]